MKKLMFLSPVLMVWMACGAPVEESAVHDVAMSEDLATQEQELSAFYTCGSQCPSGYYPTNTSFNSACAALGNVWTYCLPLNSTTYYTCGTACASGFYPANTHYNPACSAGFNGVRTYCLPLNSTAYYTCGTTCAAGYYPTSTLYNSACSQGFNGAWTYCLQR